MATCLGGEFLRMGRTSAALPHVVMEYDGADDDGTTRGGSYDDCPAFRAE
jgi:hypothetical protein